ncbi:MAG: hypothetical protein GVY28_08305, partial [Alphaproteobacteria bacterium]|nr:hypothetical protein [Alphaproteobacteria bacterium]
MSEWPVQSESPRGADVLAVGFGTAVAMWIAGYVLHSPVIAAPAWLTFVAVMGLLVVGGVVMGRSTRRTWRGGLLAAAVTTATNLLIVGSLYGELAAEYRHMLMVGVPGYLLTSLGAMMIGYAAGRPMRPGTPSEVDWPLRWVMCGVFATGLVVLAGGLVTGFDAGFAVPDWPNTFNSNMFVFPLSRMTGGIYYEHTHRLAGTLVGLIAIALSLHTLAVPTRRSVRVLAGAALAMVCAQGVAGGLWVTDVQHAAGQTAGHAAAYEATPQLGY